MCAESVMCEVRTGAAPTGDPGLLKGLGSCMGLDALSSDLSFILKHSDTKQDTKNTVHHY